MGLCVREGARKREGENLEVCVVFLTLKESDLSSSWFGRHLFHLFRRGRCPTPIGLPHSTTAERRKKILHKQNKRTGWCMASITEIRHHIEVLRIASPPRWPLPAKELCQTKKRKKKIPQPKQKARMYYLLLIMNEASPSVLGNAERDGY